MFSSATRAELPAAGLQIERYSLHESRDLEQVVSDIPDPGIRAQIGGLEERPELGRGDLRLSGVGVRLGVKTTGCSGLAYKLEYADEIAPEDIVFEGHGVKVLVDPKSLPYIDGTELDFVREGLNEGFKFHNPREKDRCGCGESFRV